MQLQRIVTMASEAVRIDFMAMYRSLRETGCDVPVDVIPFGDQRFELPSGARWWDCPVRWMKQHFGDSIRHPLQYRFYLLACGGYQVADTDLVFLRNPSKVLRPYNGLVVACHQWHLAHKAAPQTTLDRLRTLSSTWQSKLFNAGQFAASDPLFELEELAALLRQPSIAEHAFLNESPWDQGGFNLLAAQRRAPMVNLCLPPQRMESTWAADYTGDYRQFWTDQRATPYLIHWAGGCLDYDLPINELFFQFLTRAEADAWRRNQQERHARDAVTYRRSLRPHQRAYFEAKQCVKRLLSV